MQINKHGSFYMRNGWSYKIIDAIQNDEMIFSPNNELKAVDDIGVGRVMIKAMRYWSVVMGLSDEIKSQRGVIHKLTELGEIIAKYDRYCQNIGTLWLMHRKLSSNIESSTAWYWAFNQFNEKTFNKELFVSEFYTFLQKNGENYVKKAVEKEFDCFKNTYVSEKVFDISKIIDEDAFPLFAPLKLIKYGENGNFYFKKSQTKDIPLLILLYCIISDNAEHLKSNTQIGLEQILEGENQVGKYMCLSYATLLELLQQLENAKKISLVNNFGNRYIQLNLLDTNLILTNYYEGVKS